MVGHTHVWSRLFVCAALAVGALTGCGDALQGSGKKVEETRQLPEFKSIRAGDGLPVIVTVGAALAQEVRLIGDDNLVARLETQVDDMGQFSVRMPMEVSDWYSLAGLHVEVKVPRLEGLGCSGGGTAKVEGLDTDTFTLEASGGGTVTLSGRATTFRSDISGGSVLNARTFSTQDAHLISSGGGSTALSVSESLRVEASGGGEVRIFGSPRVLSQALSGGSTLTFN